MIKQAQISDAKIAAELALLLWPDNELKDFILNMKSFITGENSVIFLAVDADQAIGFAQCQLRTDYVEGTDSSPVGYLEGLFVLDNYRQQGIARTLVEACEKWALTKGCTEFASDCELDNTDSMHIKLGFTEANRIICFTKKLGE
ncbi:GNAT family N-acetyltransferase [Solibacillus sp. MA9]|uniref:Aminoglycoside N(6')-acetyltransferase type 1 n=1 Tax=Solibacillus palustris TaxID=2908203 RepID=A0ABS9UAL9_9BACL|nr:aminoglycoside 6'-N-acetyltransferase [Solibacillus sp. MA9]MCH7321364.1 GNAT family N-acetyltransferase [Solibacillus sp. MA9]